ncbi:tetratricopeptide repeat protein [Paracoccus sp. MBLB3053]|uniref:Tetratricopeptide repeat protein n=1 Tax=Paracoccus aurantius TaxID=3073814 RepID=A0ABU2HU92_9RHOB|nr:tetratricopeptide repeat protein [Paracoccus sp. MBLB3053]MDS9468625.1 tetratricopeptide repeat protein [Paracoccus sp. MBLB3053]
MNLNDRFEDHIPSRDAQAKADTMRQAALALLPPHEIKPRDNTRRFELADASRAEGSYELAQALYEAVLLTKPDNVKALRQNAACRLAAGKINEALASAEAGLLILPQDPVLERIRLNSAKRLGTLQSQPAASTSLSPKRILDLARKHLHQSKPEEAASLLDELLSKYPAHIHGLALRAHVALRTGDLEGALKFCARGLEVRPDHPGILTTRAKALSRRGQHETALGQLEEAYRTNPDLDAGAKFALAEARLAAGQEIQADVMYVEVLNEAPGDPRAHLSRIRNALSAGDINEALERCDAALVDHPGDPRFLGRRAHVLLQAGRADEALSILEALKAKATSRPQLRRQLASTLLAVGRRSEAKQILLELLTIDPGDSDARLGLAEIADQEGDSAAALKMMEGALSPAADLNNSAGEPPAPSGAIATERPGPILKYLQLCLKHGRTNQARQILEGIGSPDEHWSMPQLMSLSGLAQKTGAMPVLSSTLQASLARDVLSPGMALNILRMGQATGNERLALKLRDQLQIKLPLGQQDLFRLRSDLTIYGPEGALTRLRATRIARRNPIQAEALGDLLAKAGQRELCLRYLRHCRRRWPASLPILKLQNAAMNRFGAAQAALDELESMPISNGAETKRLRIRSLIALGRLEDVLQIVDQMDPGQRKPLGSQGQMMIRLAMGDAKGAAALVDAVAAESSRSERTKARFRVSHLGAFLNELQLIGSDLPSVVACPDKIAEDLKRGFYFPAKRSIDAWQASVKSPSRLRNESEIPRRIVQYWDQNEIPPVIAGLMQSWQKVPGYSYQRYSRQTAIAFLNERFEPSYVRAFKLTHSPAEQCDFLRLCLLFADGGIYADADDLLLGDVDQLRCRGAGVVLYRECFGAIGNNFLAARPGHALFRRAAEMARDSLLARENDLTWSKLGPGLMTRATALHVSTEPDEDLTLISEQDLSQVVQIHMTLPYKATPAYWNNREGRAPDSIIKILSDFANGSKATSDHDPKTDPTKIIKGSGEPASPR